ncbi:MAG: alpha/beta hydrolase [Candidatus Kapabacteria bacterium]|nr:alpha/beta hydrolase [Candidatus Kapabacteria bacterium]
MTHTFHNNGVLLEYIDVSTIGSGGLPCVFVPGLCAAATEVADALAPVFQGTGYVLSVRGRGGSGSPAENEYTLDHQASDVVALVRHLNLSDCVLAGHSVGASIAIRAAGALQSVLRGLVILDFPPFYPPIDKSWAAQILAMPHEGISDAALTGLAACGEYIDLFDELQAITAPLRIVYATGEDAAIRPEHVEVLQRNFPAASILPIDSGHELFHTNPVAAMELISGMLGREE